MHSNKIINEAYTELFGEPTHTLELKYNGRFKAYNARVSMTRTHIIVHAAKEWRTVSPDIQKGLIQELLVRLLNKKTHTLAMDLYSHFIKSLPKYTDKTETHPTLSESFNRVNAAQFNGSMDQPNLKIGNGITQLGRYDYATDTITITKHLLDHPDLLDYVMHHEMLHKHFKFTAKNGRHCHHGREFKDAEAAYPNAKHHEAALETLVRLLKRNKP